MVLKMTSCEVPASSQTTCASFEITKRSANKLFRISLSSPAPLVAPESRVGFSKMTDRARSAPAMRREDGLNDDPETQLSFSPFFPQKTKQKPVLTSTSSPGNGSHAKASSTSPFFSSDKMTATRGAPSLKRFMNTQTRINTRKE